MESRRIYLGVATFLRGNHQAIVDVSEYWHTPVVLKLRSEVLESETLLMTRLAYTIAAAALHSHPGTDLDKAVQQTNRMFTDALLAIPYLTQGQSSADIENAERMRAIERYRQMFQEKK